MYYRPGTGGHSCTVHALHVHSPGGSTFLREMTSLKTLEIHVVTSY